MDRYSAEILRIREKYKQILDLDRLKTFVSWNSEIGPSAVKAAKGVGVSAPETIQYGPDLYGEEFIMSDEELRRWKEKRK